MGSGFANIHRPTSGSWPNEGCVGTLPEGLPNLRGTCANAIQHISTTVWFGPAGRGLGGARGGVDFETDCDRWDASRFAGCQVDLRRQPRPRPRGGWIRARTYLQRNTGTTAVSCATTGARGDRSASGVNRPEGVPAGGRGRRAAAVARKTQTSGGRVRQAWPPATTPETREEQPNGPLRWPPTRPVRSGEAHWIMPLETFGSGCVSSLITGGSRCLLGRWHRSAG